MSRKTKLNNKHFFAANFIFWILPKASSSDTNRIQAKLIPDKANVIKNRYTDITNSNTPTDSVPILLEIYTLKNILIVLNISAVQVSIVPLTKKNFIFFKNYHLTYQSIC